MVDLINSEKINVQEGLLETKLSKLKNLADKKVENLSPEDKAKFAQAARGFESMFINLLWKEMKNAMLDKDSEDSESLSFGSDTLETYTDLSFSEELSKIGSGIGIADKIYEFLTGGDKLSPLTVTVPDNFRKAIENKIMPEGIDNLKKSKNFEKIEKIAGNFIERLNTRLSSYANAIDRASQIYNIDKNLIKAVIAAESAGRKDAVSKAGAKGLMQLMDGTASDLGVRNSFDPIENIMGGAKYLKMMLDKFDDNVDLALAAYNAGPGNVIKHKGIPPFEETRAYVSRVKRYHNMFNSQSV
ncbi:MAG: transglycosylase SLT domain-containing protein [Candidatus Kapabacteria bacterium]|nr:transglycosylase SLT domain-containing protein [Candidatus Kapabacteria bacterium]